MGADLQTYSVAACYRHENMTAVSVIYNEREKLENAEIRAVM